jgi:peptide/nickel transport system ATP-binding protein
MLEIRGLRVAYFAAGDRSVVVRDVDIDVPSGVAVALVGESGSGKSTVALSIMGLISPPTGRIEAGAIKLDGRDLIKLRHKEMSAILHKDIGYIPQDPTTALDPLFTVYSQIAEILPAATGRRDRRRVIAQLLESLA